MARIRTIKPEFPQSESMGRVSRDSRLLFVLLWTLCDDSGRTRAASRMLASLLFPYDDDAPKRIEGWLSELEREGCIRRYSVDGDTYLEVLNWLKHQKIDRPSPSKIPAFDESSRMIASDREGSSLDQGSRIKDQGRDQGPKDAGLSPAVVPPVAKNPELRKTASEVIAFLNEKAGRNYDLNGANADHVIARLKDGATVDDLRAVVAKKCRDWRGDEKMAMYLRPETLFNRTKFASYKGELGAA